MKPVLVLQHLSADGPAHLAAWLARAQAPFEVLNTQARDVYPLDMSGHGALAVLGGEMSANDPLPSLRQCEHLIRDAIARGIPVLGHCLGAQLMARALGAVVKVLPQPEIGWHRVRVLDGASAWFGGVREPEVFQWHYEGFELPRGATLLAASDACPHQAFAVGPHIGTQFHSELDESKLEGWLADADPRAEAARDGPFVATAEEMRHRLAPRLAAQQALADRIYQRWLSAAA